MTTDVMPFHFGTREVRTLNIDGAPWFVGKDVAELLGYADPTTAIRSHCDGVQKLHPIVDALGRRQEVRVIEEPDVWRLIVGSHLPEAKRIERWIFEDVLPTIRRTGGYTKHAAGISVAQDRAMARASKLLDQLVEAKSKEQRRSLHAMLLTVAPEAGFQAPPLDAFEPKPLPDPFDRVRQDFWQAVTVLESAYGADLDHHVKELICAYNVPEVSKLAIQHGMPLASASELAKALSGDHRFIQYTGVNSRHRKATVRCYCFRSHSAQEALDAASLEHV
jgi:prophage antirepressor-like protein